MIKILYISDIGPIGGIKSFILNYHKWREVNDDDNNNN